MGCPVAYDLFDEFPTRDTRAFQRTAPRRPYNYACKVMIWRLTKIQHRPKAMTGTTALPMS